MSRGSTIMFIDDNEALREAFARLLEREGYQVLQAESAQEGLATLREMASPPDLIISDMILPGPDGREFLHRLTRVAATTPVLLISGYPREEAERLAGIITGANFLSKPFGVQELFAKVREFLDKPEPDAIR